MTHTLTYKLFSERSILITWPARISETILNDMLCFKHKIENSISSFLYATNAYHTLLVHFNSDFVFDDFVKQLKMLYKDKGKDLKTEPSRLWRIPVCYDTCFGIDLEAMALDKKMTVKSIVETHCATPYTVYFIGFLPGFLYLGGLDNILATPRKASPRLEVKKGAVAIGGMQTGVYPNASPGGWHIIGNSPIHFFNPLLDTPCFARPGDKIEFYPISLKTHQDISVLVKEQVYVLDYKLL